MKNELFIDINELWDSNQEYMWETALKMYKEVRSVIRNYYLEEQMDCSDDFLNRFRNMNSTELYDFFINEFIVWKYTSPNRKATVTYCFVKKHAVSPCELEEIRNNVLELYDRDALNTRELLGEITKIGGIGTAGGSALLSLLFPNQYGTVDQYLVKAIVGIKSYSPELHRKLSRIKPDDITIIQAILLEELLREKAKCLNDTFRTNEWTPRKIDKILWSFGRTTCLNKK